MKTFRIIAFIIFLLVIVVLFGLSYWTFALYVLLGVLLASWLMTLQSLTGIVHTRVLTRKEVDIGEKVTVSTEVKNTASMPVLWVLLEDNVTERLPIEGERIKVVLLRSGQSVVLKYTIDCKWRGYHQIGPLLMESGDVFGLRRKFRVGKEADYVTVLPKVVPISRYEIPTHRPIGEVRVQTRIYEDPTRLAGVREYVRGDSLSRIHWKTTARTGTLHSKIYDPTVMMGAHVILDFHGPSWQEPEAFERSELGVTSAASIAAFILEHKQQVGFLSNGRDALDRIKWEREETEATSRTEARRMVELVEKSDRLRPVEVRLRRGDTQLRDILVTLARLEMSDGLPLHEMLLNEYHRLPRDAAMICLVPQVTYELAEVLHEMKRVGFVVVAFVMNRQSAFEMAVQRLAALGIDCYHIRDEVDLDELGIKQF